MVSGVDGGLPIVRRSGEPEKVSQPVTGKPATERLIDDVNRGIQIVRRQAARFEQNDENEPIPYGIDIETVERLARQQMTIEQIAIYMKIPKDVFRDVLIRFPRLRHAFEFGAVSLLETASANIAAAVESGDLGTSRFVLERKGGWTPPPRDPPVIVVQGPGVTIDGDHVEDLQTIQRRFRDAPDADMS